MPCYSPLTGFKSRTITASGKRKLVFDAQNGYADLPVTVPCGNCLGCRLERSRQWAVRLMHEAQMHELSIFVTLTYDDQHLPKGGSLVKKHYQDFMKRLRRSTGFPVRFFHCGEYGETTKRPHYHAILYGIDFADKKIHSTNGQGQTLYTSEKLQATWGHGHCLIGAVTQDSCAYVARYILKKINGKLAREHYERVNLETGEIFNLLPEYVTMSRKPGLGFNWYQRFKNDVFPSDTIIQKGKEQLPPKYYFKLLEEDHKKLHAKLKSKRIRRAAKHKANSTPDRLSARLICRQSKIKTLKRAL